VGTVTTRSAAPGRSLPLWLLDVDGVLNVVTLAPDATLWPRWRRGVARTDDRSRAWPITWSPDVIDRLTDLLTARRVEIAWLTTWGEDANDELAALLGLPQLPVAGCPPSRVVTSGGLSGTGRPASTHAEVAGADAADPLTGRWWKFGALRRLYAVDPGRPLVWTDDDLALEPQVTAWMRAHTTSLLVAPDPRHGLTPQHLIAIDRFLQVHAGAPERPGTDGYHVSGLPSR
jgi:HAD domain in Swiss Army Knife RNA repair proteins